ncbi:MAG: hypothetical protein BGO67_10690 [Alphaproteobacteria bacterium 41-28]|nr:MAG: hypothetical protein BGO67_10690 [Alphaproteobacteria bacterium 41-28]
MPYAHEKKDHLFTEPNKPSKPPTQSVQIYNGRPSIMPFEEKILMRIVPGKDGRVRVHQTTDWPHLIHGQLSMEYSDGEYGGSGILVGPHHVLTAGHNVYNSDKKEWAQNIYVRLGLNETIAPFGGIKVAKICTFNSWVQKKDSRYDMALLILERSIGYETGWCGLLSLDNESLLKEEVTITGYPGDQGCNKMMTMAHTIKNVEPEKFYYDIDTNKGQSGSGVWINKWRSPYVIGVHTLGEGALFTGNSGVRLSHSKLKKVTKWISKNLALQQHDSTQREQPDPQKSSEEIYKEAMTFYNGDNVEKDYIKAADLLKVAANQEFVEAEYQLGMCYRMGHGVNTNFRKAFDLFKKAADKNHTVAYYQLGILYKGGNIVHQDIDKSTELIKKSADLGYVDGIYLLGLSLEYGHNCYSKDLTLAKECFKKAAALGDPNAREKLKHL